jgi:aryl-alcohol dehydrogenase-like predicted oxidoreductase
VNYSGNHAKSLHVSVEASLKKLCTSYIDILYVHWWDWTTSVEEIMNALHNMVAQGKVLYLVCCITALSVNDSHPHGVKGNL